MRQFLPIVLSLSLGRFPFAQMEPTTRTVAPGTTVEIELLENISSESLHAGQTVSFKLIRSLEVNGASLLGAGTSFNGKVTKVDRVGHWGKAGALDLKLEPLRLTDGTLVHLDFYRPAKLNARGEKRGEETLTGIAMVYYFPLIPVALMLDSRKGKPFKIRAGERYLVYVTGTEAAPAAKEPPKP